MPIKYILLSGTLKENPNSLVLMNGFLQSAVVLNQPLVNLHLMVLFGQLFLKKHLPKYTEVMLKSKLEAYFILINLKKFLYFFSCIA